MYLKFETGNIGLLAKWAFVVSPPPPPPRSAIISLFAYLSPDKIASCVSRKIPFLKSLAGIYGFLGNDYSLAFFKKGKKRPIELMARVPKFVDAFEKFGETELNEEIYVTVEECVCHLYGYKRETDINVVRSLMFTSKTKPKSMKRSPLDGLKSIYPRVFPPCRRELEQQIKRGWFVAMLYKSTTEQFPFYDKTPIDYGWKLSECKEFIVIDWFHGEQVPAQVENLVTSTSQEGEEEDESDRESGESDSSDSEDSSEED